MSEEDFMDFSFSENTDARCALSLILDCSDSMGQTFPGESKSAIEALNSGLDVLVSELNKDPLAKRRVEVSIVTYGTEVSDPTEFSTVDDLILPTLTTSGVTSTGKAVEAGLQSIKDRKQVYKNNGIQYYRPWALLMTDGLATDDISGAKKMIEEMEQKKAVNFFAIGIEGADLDKLGELSVRKPMKLDGLKFDELFQWLSASQSAVSSSNPGEGGVKLPPPNDWAEIDV